MAGLTPPPRALMRYVPDKVPNGQFRPRDHTLIGTPGLPALQTPPLRSCMRNGDTTRSWPRAHNSQPHGSRPAQRELDDHQEPSNVHFAVVAGSRIKETYVPKSRNRGPGNRPVTVYSTGRAATVVPGHNLGPAPPANGLISYCRDQKRTIISAAQPVSNSLDEAAEIEHSKSKSSPSSPPFNGLNNGRGREDVPLEYRGLLSLHGRFGGITFAASETPILPGQQGSHEGAESLAIAALEIQTLPTIPPPAATKDNEKTRPSTLRPRSEGPPVPKKDHPNAGRDRDGFLEEVAGVDLDHVLEAQQPYGHPNDHLTLSQRLLSLAARSRAIFRTCIRRLCAMQAKSPVAKRPKPPQSQQPLLSLRKSKWRPWEGARRRTVERDEEQHRLRSGQSSGRSAIISGSFVVLPSLEEASPGDVLERRSTRWSPSMGRTESANTDPEANLCGRPLSTGEVCTRNEGRTEVERQSSPPIEACTNSKIEHNPSLPPPTEDGPSAHRLLTPSNPASGSAASSKQATRTPSTATSMIPSDRSEQQEKTSSPLCTASTSFLEHARKDISLLNTSQEAIGHQRRSYPHSELTSVSSHSVRLLLAASIQREGTRHALRSGPVRCANVRNCKKRPAGIVDLMLRLLRSHSFQPRVAAIYEILKGLNHHMALVPSPKAEYSRIRECHCDADLLMVYLSDVKDRGICCCGHAWDCVGVIAKALRVVECEIVLVKPEVIGFKQLEETRLSYERWRWIC